MGLRLILGRAGSGKTARCMKEIAQAFAAQPQNQYFLITPEQATFSSEKRLLIALGGRGGFNVKVLSFRRFVWAVLQETGGGLATPLDKVGKSLILRSLLEARKAELQSFRQVYFQKGFLEQLVGLMDELRSYEIPQQAFQPCLQAAQSSGSGFQGKLVDLQSLYGDYCQALSTGWLDLAGELALLCEKLPQWKTLGKTMFWLDGFHGFTPAEYQVIGTLLGAGCSVQVTLNLPAGWEKNTLGEEAVFYPPWETARDLQRLCQSRGYEIDPPHYLPLPGQVRFGANPALAYLEQMAGQNGGGGSYPGKPEGLTIQGFANLQQEVEGVANQILQCARAKGWRYRDMTLLIRQPELYESTLRTVFQAYELPFFFDSPKALNDHPLINLLRSLLSFVDNRWNHQGLFTYIKTGMTGLSLNQADSLENYCLAYGIGRQHWESSQRWHFAENRNQKRAAGGGQAEAKKQDHQMEVLRQRLWQPLVQLEQALAAATNLRQMIQALYQHLQRLKAETHCRRLAFAARMAGQPEAALLHEKVWQDGMKLLDQVVAFMGEQIIQRSDLARILQSGLEAMETLTVPPAIDQVVVSSMDRSRTPQAKAVWILGVNEGVLPARLKETGLLSSRERKWLENQGLQLAPDADKRLFSESYLIYIACTRASQELHFSFARADHDGKGQAPSPFLHRLCRCFPDLELQDQALPTETLISRPGPTLQNLSRALQDRQPAAGEIGLWRYLYHWFKARPQWQWALGRVTQGLELESLQKQIPPGLSQALFGQALRTSVTRLEQFQACPFAHFMAYGLGLQPREEYEVGPPQVGSFFHDSLEALLLGLQAEGRNLADLPESELAQRINKTVDQQLSGNQYGIFLTSAWYKALSRNLSRILSRSALVLAEHERRGCFRPLALELGFGFEETDSLPPIILDLGQGQSVALRGRMDRVDGACKPGEEDTTYLRIVDYKAGFKTLSLWEIYYGLKLQLILYLDVALTGLGQRLQPGILARNPQQNVGCTKPAGIFYFHVADPMLRLDNSLLVDPQAQKEQRLKALKLQGYALADKSLIQMMDQEIQGSSLILPVNILNSGEFGARSALCSEAGFMRLRQHGKAILSQAARRMLAGEISLSPYQAANRTACDYCEYRSVCRFDLTIPGHQYRQLPPLRDQQVWQLLNVHEKGDQPQ